MIEKLRMRIMNFIESDKDVPLLAGFSVGFYIMVFYYSKNFALANSIQQLVVLTAYYVIFPALTLFIGYKILGKIKAGIYQRNFLFIGLLTFFILFLLQINHAWSYKKVIFGVLLVIIVLLSFKISRYYKLFILLLFLMTAFNIRPLAGAAYKFITASDEWKKMPDNIENVVFKHKPNIYYIQPDGYTSFNNLRHNPYYNFDNSSYEAFLKQNGFTLYQDYRSNYPSTLLSNSATFSMKHHYIAKDVESYAARGIIMGNNPVLRILKNNGYRTSFITQNPYLIMNRPKSGYDYCNIPYSDIPYIKDGFTTTRDVMPDFKSHMDKKSKTGNFYFIERFLPGHVTVYENGNSIEDEKKIYLDRLKQSNDWLKEIITFITKYDPDGLIIIGADHGGFTGFSSTLSSFQKTDDKSLIYSIFGAQLAIKWNSPLSEQYDSELNTGVNLFRTVFSFLAEDEKYLQHMEEDSSFMHLHNPGGKYKYIDDQGDTVFEPI